MNVRQLKTTARDARAGDPLAHDALFETSWEALGTTVVLRVSEAAALWPARAAVERELAAIDRACSRFREDSELAYVNSRAGRRMAVQPLLLEALELALRAASLTDGDVDPTVGRALELAGYDRDWRLLDAAGEAPARPRALIARTHSGWRSVELDHAGSWVRVPAGITLDLGATAKALAADRAAAAAADAAGCGALVSLGGDLATAGPAPRQGWLVRVTDDHRSATDAPGQTIAIADGGLATSSTTVRRWSHEGRTRHHIIDPRSGEPALGRWRTVSVAAASCADANIASTAALVRGSRAGAWLSEQGLPARMVDRRGRVSVVGGWPEKDPSPTHAEAA
jgi:thiamine biosynthesis lipoprotein